MKILVLHGSYRSGGTTSELARSFMDGTRVGGAEVEMIMLRECRIEHCANCLKCYGYADEGIAPCSLRDDMDGIIARIAQADGVLFASPVHNGFVTGLMTVFWARLSWRAARPGGPFLKSMSLASRLDDRIRSLGSIASAGGMPERMRKSCDDGTPWLKSNGRLILHGEWVGDVYAGADLERMPESGRDWRRIYFLRRLSARQKKRAYTPGVKMARAIRSGRLKPVTIEKMVPPVVKQVFEFIARISPPHRIAR